MTFAPPQFSGECDFCGSKIVAQPAAADPVVAPGGVLPFAVTRGRATESVRGWIGRLWFAPNALKRLAQHEELGGVYLPFWTYDAHTTSAYRGQRGEHYWETESYTAHNAQGQAETRTRRVRRTRWHAASGTVSLWFDDLLVPATRALPAKRLAALEPGTMLALSLTSRRTSRATRRSVIRSLRGRLRAGEGDGPPVTSATCRTYRRRRAARRERDDTHTRASTFKHLLLPVHVGAYRFGERSFRWSSTAARRGAGERPSSAWKSFFVLFVAAAVALVVIVFGSSE